MIHIYMYTYERYRTRDKNPKEKKKEKTSMYVFAFKIFRKSKIKSLITSRTCKASILYDVVYTWENDSFENRLFMGFPLVL